MSLVKDKIKHIQILAQVQRSMLLCWESRQNQLHSPQI